MLRNDAEPARSLDQTSRILELQRRLEEAEETLRALRRGQVDALVVSGSEGSRVFTLEGPDRPFQTFVEHMQQGAITLGSDGVILYCNEFFADLLGRAMDQVRGSRLDSHIAPDGEERFHDWLSKSETAPSGGTCDLTTSDGARIPVRLSLSIVPGTQPPLRFCVATDVREQERARAAQVAREVAEKSNEAKDRFLAMVSHELRSPLSNILGWAQILARSNPTAHELRRGVEVIERNVKAQSRLITDLLDISRMTAGKFRLELQRMDVRELVEAAVDSVSTAARDKSIVVRVEVAGDVSSLVCDPARLQQVLWNLLTNAIQNTPGGGRVELRVQRSGDALEIRIDDSGAGIAPEFLPKLFDFFQQAGSGVPRAGSLGLGLAIVKQLVELHEGTVDAMSEGVGRGSTFIVRLPDRRDDARLDAEAAPTLVPAELAGVKVLVVDDDDDARDVVSRLVADRGATTLTAASLEEALSNLDRHRPHVLVSDISMPKGGGCDLIREVRARGIGEETLPAIALSALARPEDRRRAIQAGFQLYLSKPVDDEQLATAVARLAKRPPG